MVNKKKIDKKQKRKNILLIILIIGIFLGAFIMFWISTLKIPDLNNFEERIVPQSTKIYDRTGKILLYDVHENIRRTIVPYEDISRYIKNATVAIEDSEFYEHHGIEIGSIIRATFANILSLGYGQGGSTITQQVIKNALLTNKKKISRKIKEWVLAIKLERVMSKKEILTIYLNEAPYGGNVYGVEQASMSFFGKHAKDLTLAEAAYLAAIPQAPTFYSPYGKHKDRLVERKNLVLEKMLENKFITKKEYQKAKEEKVEFIEKQTKGIKAPHFVMFIKKYLEKKYGEKALTEGGYKVTTTLDYDLQKKAEEIVKKRALSNEKKFDAKNAALVAIDVKTGQILVMVGSRDYFDKEINGNFNVATAHRQPGSAFKPFVYATAFNKGYTPDTVVYDLKTEFSTYCRPDETTMLGKCYAPGNYDHIYRGPMTLRNALAQSVNIPAIKVLYLAGLQDSLKTAKDMGIESLTNISQYGLTLVLGGGEVSLLDITSAYTVFADNGIRNPATGILEIQDSEGNIIEKFQPKPRRVLPELSALYISSILSDNKARTPAFGSRSPLYFKGRDVAGKTGTTNDYRDAWTIGYTPQVAVGVWAGNNDNSSMVKKVAGFIVTPMWNTFMKEILAKYPDEKFKKPPTDYSKSLKPVLRGIWQGGVTYFIDEISGKLATKYTPIETKKEKVVKNYHSILYWVNKKDPLGPKPENPNDDPQYPRWEYSVQKWVKEHGLVNDPKNEIPTEYDNVHIPALFPKIKILYPNSTNFYNPNKKVTVVISNSNPTIYPLMKLNYYLNGHFIGSSHSNTFSFVPSDTKNLKSKNKLKVIAFDVIYNKGVATTILNLNL